MLHGGEDQNIEEVACPHEGQPLLRRKQSLELETCPSDTPFEL